MWCRVCRWWREGISAMAAYDVCCRGSASVAKKRKQRGFLRLYLRERSVQLIVIATLACLVPIASAVQMMAYANGDVTAADIYFNIIRGSRIQDYLHAVEPFKIPVIWLCDWMLATVGCMVLFVPRSNDVETVRLLASMSRRVYWRRRMAISGIFSCMYVMWRLALCTLLSFALVGSASFMECSEKSLAFFTYNGRSEWGLSWLIGSMMLDMAVLCLSSTAASLFAAATSIPGACIASSVYVVMAVYSCQAVLLPNALMMHRVIEYSTHMTDVAGIAVGMVSLVGISELLYRKLLHRDFV